MDWYKILQMVLEILVPAVIGLGVLIAKKYLSDKVKDDTLREGLNDAIDLLGRAARDTNQTYVDAIKNSGNGLTPEQAAIARQKTKELFEQLVTDLAREAIETAYGSIDNYINLNLEAAVASIKYERGK